MPAPDLNPDLLVDAPEDGADFGTVTRGNHATHGDAFSGGNHHIDKSCVVRQNVYCAKAIEAAAFQVNTSNYGDPLDPQFDPEHVYHSSIVAGFVKNDANGNLLFGESGAAGATALDQLTDVTLTSPAGREYLCFDSGSSQWVNQVIVIDDLGDIVILSPADGDYLCYDSGSSSWINAGIPLDDLSDVSTVGATSGGEVLQFDGVSSFFMGALDINNLSNVDLTTNPPSIGDHLEYDGTNWVPGTGTGATSLDDLSDVTITSPSTDSVLQYDGANWIDRPDVELSSTNAYYLGDKDTDGTWRFVRSGSDLQVELREAGTYNSKGSFTP